MENTIMYLKKHKFEVFVYLSNNVGENKIGRKLIILQEFKESRNIEEELPRLQPQNRE